nr:hypothetical protein BAR15_120361 [Bartonella sp. AR 15-3]
MWSGCAVKGNDSVYGGDYFHRKDITSSSNKIHQIKG